MKIEYYIVLSIYGREAVKQGYIFQGNSCYRGIYEHGKRIAQLEVVVDEPGKYNGFEQAWVDVSTKKKYLQKTLKQLERLGFKGCYASILDMFEPSSENDYFNLEETTELDELDLSGFEWEKEYKCFIRI